MERLRPFTWPDGIEESALRQKKVSCTIPVHAEYRRITHRREGATLLNSVYKDTGCIVVAHWEQSTIKRFDVFVGAGSKSAIAVINKWIARGDQKSKDSAAWAKTPAFNHAQWYQEELERQEEERMAFFLGPIPDAQEGEPVRPKIVVDWPEDLLNHEVTPRTAFGNTLQALDDIRKRDQVFITQLPNHRIEILGFDINNVDAAEMHYKTMVVRILTEKCSMQQTTNMILDVREGIDVALVRAEKWWPACADIVVPRLLPSPMMDQPGSFRGDGLHDTQLVEIRNPIKRALESVRHKKGSYDFVVRLGCIALDSRKIGEERIGKHVSKDKFIRDIKDAVDLMPKKWLLDHARGVQLYRRLVESKDFLEPIKAAGYWGTMPANLEDTRPSFRGTWIFEDPSSPLKQPPPPRNVGRPTPVTPPIVAASAPSSLIVVQVDWTDDGEGSYDKTDTKFYKLEPGKGGAKVHMDIHLLELGESRGWSFNLESMTPISRSTVPPVLTGFAQRVVMRPGYNMTSTQSFAEWDKSPSVKKLLIGGRLDRIYSFGIQETCYKVELITMWYPNEQLPCWALAVRHTEWATHLAELERLQTGHQADWGDIIATFLPDDGGSSIIPEEDDDFGASKLKLNGDGNDLPRKLSREGIRTLTNILLQLSEVISLVTMGQGGVQI